VPPKPEARSAAAAWVYVLRCADGSLYTGWTVDIERRVAAHAAGRGSRYTRSRLPVELLAALPMEDSSRARREEARIKQLPRAAKLALLADVAYAACVSPSSRSGSSDSSVSARVSLAGSRGEPAITSSGGAVPFGRKPDFIPK
jgi:putative endonuclease